MKVLVDSSAIVALLFANDDNHQAAVDCLRRLTIEGAELLLSNFVLAETYNLLAVRTYPARAREWLLRNTWPVERITVADEEEAFRIIERHADKDYSYTDATSFALMRRLACDIAFTFDQHFAQFGLRTQSTLPGH